MTKPSFARGSASAPGLKVGSATSGVLQLMSRTWSLYNAYQGSTPAENHKYIHILPDKGIVFGTLTPQRVLPFCSAIEINHSNPASGAAVPGSHGAWMNSGSDVPLFMVFNRAVNGGPVNAGTILGSIEFWGDAVVPALAARIVARVPSDWVDPGSGSNRIAAEIAFQVAPGDGSTDPQDALIIDRNKNFNVVSGTLYVSSVITVFPAGATKIVQPNFRNKRQAMSPGDVLALAIPHGETAVVTYLCESTAANASPWGCVFVNSATTDAPIEAWVLGSTGVTYTGGAVPNGSTGASGKLNFFSNGDGNLYVESRLPGAQNYSFHIVA